MSILAEALLQFEPKSLLKSASLTLQFKCFLNANIQLSQDQQQQNPVCVRSKDIISLLLFFPPKRLFNRIWAFLQSAFLLWITELLRLDKTSKTKSITAAFITKLYPQVPYPQTFERFQRWWIHHFPTQFNILWQWSPSKKPTDCQSAKSSTNSFLFSPMRHSKRLKTHRCSITNIYLLLPIRDTHRGLLSLKYALKLHIAAISVRRGMPPVCLAFRDCTPGRETTIINHCITNLSL